MPPPLALGADAVADGHRRRGRRARHRTAPGAQRLTRHGLAGAAGRGGDAAGSHRLRPGDGRDAAPGRGRSASLADYIARGGGEGLRGRGHGAGRDRAGVTDSGLRGRGGAAFPAGIKWRTVHGAAAAQKYIVCNADEGDSGTFSDRMLMEGDPFCLLEGMAIAGARWAPTAATSMCAPNIRMPSPHCMRRAGGRRFPRRLPRAAKCARAPAPTSAARKPRCWKAWRASAASCAPSRRCRRSRACSASRRVINNVITLASVPDILARRRGGLPRLGTGRSRGTLPIQLAGNIRAAGWSSCPSASRCASCSTTSAAARASGRPLARCRSAGRSAPTCRSRSSTRRSTTRPSPPSARARPRRHRGVRRHGGHGEAGALRDGVLRHRILRQVHALPHRLDARRRVIDRIRAGDRARAEPRRCCATSARHDGAGLAVRHGRHDADARC
jgi:formate dehydrogenase iron-sulfur subunit